MPYGVRALVPKHIAITRVSCVAWSDGVRRVPVKSLSCYCGFSFSRQRKSVAGFRNRLKQSNLPSR